MLKPPIFTATIKLGFEVEFNKDLPTATVELENISIPVKALETKIYIFVASKFQKV